MIKFTLFFILWLKLISCQDFKIFPTNQDNLDYNTVYNKKVCNFCSMACPSTAYDLDSIKRTSKHFDDFLKMLDNVRELNDNFMKGLNLSGRLEPALYVEEPNYIILRNDDDLQNAEYDPFIPPRGRKHENGKPNINGLIRQYNDLFVPNRGKKDNKERIRKDKIKDIFKYDDLFIPNRGKKCSDKSLCDQQEMLLRPNLDSPLAKYFRMITSNKVHKLFTN